MTKVTPLLFNEDEDLLEAALANLPESDGSSGPPQLPDSPLRPSTLPPVQLPVKPIWNKDPTAGNHDESAQLFRLNANLLSPLSEENRAKRMQRESLEGTRNERRVKLKEEINAPKIISPAEKSRRKHFQAAVLNAEHWSSNHFKMLYLIHNFTQGSAPQPILDSPGDGPPSKSPNDCWVRKIPLLVLIYEAIVAGLFDYDYAPASVTIGTRRIYLNLSQEGVDDLDDLRESEMVNCLTISSSEYTTISAYQVSDYGERLMSHLEPEEREVVDRFCFPSLQRPVGSVGPDELETHLLEVCWNEESEAFTLYNDSGYSIKSTVTEVEDVSYVCSPYIPASLQPLLGAGEGEMDASGLVSNENIAKEVVAMVANSASGHNLRDELTEIIHLSNVKILVGEWIPFGANLIANLNEKLGSVNRVKFGIFTSLVDEMPESTRFRQANLDMGNKVSVVSHELSTFVNFTADVRFEEDESVVQVEEFGISVWKDGTVIYGLDVECILDRFKSHISLDHLARLLVDIHQDSSEIAKNLVSAYQRFLLDTLYTGHPDKRPKYNLIIAKGITPLLRAEEYMDKESNETELKQVLGDTRQAFDLGGEHQEVVVFGRDGLCLSGKESDAFDPSRHEKYLLAFLSLMAREHAIHQFFSRIFHSGHVLARISELLSNYDKYPGSISEIRKLQSQASKNLNFLHEILGYLEQSLEDVSYLQGGHCFMELPPQPDKEEDEAGHRLYELLNLRNTQRGLKARVQDMSKNLKGVRSELESIRQETDYIVQKESQMALEAMEGHTHNLEDSQRLQDRANSSLEIMQVILAGSLAFDIVDRTTLFYLSLDHSDSVFKPLVDNSLCYFGLNLAVWFLFGYALIKFMRRQVEVATGILSYRLTLNKKINHAAFIKWIQTKQISMEDSSLEAVGKAHMRKIQYQENAAVAWRDTRPTFDIWYNSDPKDCFLYKVFMQVERVRGVQVWDEVSLRDALERELKTAGVCESLDARNDDWVDRGNLRNPWRLRSKGVQQLGKDRARYSASLSPQSSSKTRSP